MTEEKSKTEQSIIEINMDLVSDSELMLYFDSGLLDHEIVTYARDAYEASFIEENGERLTAVIHILDETYDNYKIGDMPKSLPLLFVVSDSAILVLTNHKTSAQFARIRSDLSQHKSNKVLLFEAIMLLTKAYFKLMEKIITLRDDVIKDLQKRPRKENIAKLAKLQSGSVYLLMAAQQNADMLKDFNNLSSYEASSDEEKEVFTDAIIESRQLYQMTSLHERLLNEIASSYNNVLSNRLNDNITNLTILSIGLAIVTAVSSFYGMNIKLPFAKVDIVWLLITVISSLVAFICMVWMRQYVNKDHDDD
ncbi:magnesium transporter CorA family protein [Streptococcus hongkongensis]|nr:magnesium transporter CorA [Streptococcus uberis]